MAEFFTQVGAIRWPQRLQESAADYGYSNDGIQTALYEAYPSVVEVLIGRQHHPIMELFSNHMATQRDKFSKGRKNSKLQLNANNTLYFASLLPFSVPVPLGDTSLSDDLLADLKFQIGSQTEHGVDDDTLLCVGRILFNLVILRKHLGRPPENDVDIFELVKTHKVARIWTNHEQALAACYGEDNTSPDAIFRTTPNPDLWELKVVVDPELLLPEDQSFVAVQGPVQWTVRPGLSGPGLYKPRRYKPPYLRLEKTDLRPKPRPAYKTGAVTDAQTTPEKRLLDEPSTDEIPRTKRQKVLISNRPTKAPATQQADGLKVAEGGVEGTQSLANVRRSTRTRKKPAL